MFAGSNRPTVTAMSEGGRFTADLKPGVYVMTATSPDYRSDALCEAVRPVRASVGALASVDVFCQVR